MQWQNQSHAGCLLHAAPSAMPWSPCSGETPAAWVMATHGPTWQAASATAAREAAAAHKQLLGQLEQRRAALLKVRAVITLLDGRCGVITLYFEVEVGCAPSRCSCDSCCSAVKLSTQQRTVQCTVHHTTDGAGTCMRWRQCILQTPCMLLPLMLAGHWPVT